MASIKMYLTGAIHMNDYLKQLDEETREYFKILSSDFPEWLIEYMEFYKR